MKKIPILFAIMAISSGFAHASPASTSAEWYHKAVKAEQAGDVAGARDAYTKALQVNPNNANARYRLGQLRINEKSILAKKREAEIGAVMIPEIHLEEVSVKEALDALMVLMEKHSEGEIAPNFVIQDPKGKLAERKVSFRLKNLPVRAVLQYVLTESGAKARYEEHAVVILPN